VNQLIPAQLVAQRDQAIADLLALRDAHRQAIAGVDSALQALGYLKDLPGTSRAAKERPNGTYAMLGRYIGEGWDGVGYITAKRAAPWMLDHGWKHTARSTPAQTVAPALAKLARGSGAILRREWQGKYLPVGHGSVMPGSSEQLAIRDAR
jgi:hypothetical protein